MASPVVWDEVWYGWKNYSTCSDFGLQSLYPFYNRGSGVALHKGNYLYGASI